MGSRASSTEALLRFARQEDPSTASFDEADVSAEALSGIPATIAVPKNTRGGLDLGGRDLSGAQMRRANLAGCNLQGANLNHALAAGLSLKGASVEGASLIRVDLVGADLSAAEAGEADFTEALLEDTRFTAARLRFANFTEAIVEGGNFSEADLWGARLRRVAGNRATFKRAVLDESSLLESDFSGADFTGATLRRADLANCNLSNATLNDAVLDGANLAGANLAGASLPNVSLSTCNLARASFAGAWLERTRMRARQIDGEVGEEATGNLEAALDSYVVLERNFQSLGLSDDASWAYLRRRRVGRKLHGQRTRQAWAARQRRPALSLGFQWMGDVTAEWLCEYGESLSHVARAFVSILLAFALLYWATGSLKTREGFDRTHLGDPINYLLFSLNSMTTVGTSEVALRPRGEFATLLSSLQTVIGTILLGLFGFVLGARIRN